jgi:hypothetical protein
MTKRLLLIVCLALLACDNTEPDQTPQIGTAERRARDSVIGQSQLPNAKAVQRAFSVDSAAAARAAALDSIR